MTGNELNFTVCTLERPYCCSFGPQQAINWPTVRYLPSQTRPALRVCNGNNSRFTAPASTNLAAETRYFVFVDSLQVPIFGGIEGSSSTNDDTGGAAGWSIDDTSYYKFLGTGDWKTDAGTCCLLKFTVKGTTNTTTSTDATLSGLELEDNNGAAITLSPGFSSTTTSYTASVANAVDKITMVLDVNDSNATYEFQDSGGTALADADDMEDDFQVDLDVGANTIKVKVTAEDGNTNRYLHGSADTRRPPPSTRR